MIDVICATRSRPERAREMIESIRATATGFVRITLGVDEDDPRLPDYESMVDVNLSIAKSAGGGIAVANRLVKATDGEFIQIMSDDCLMLTDGWDEIMIRDCPSDHIAVLSGMTLEQKMKRIVFHPMMTRRWVDIVGWVFQPEVRHYCVDWALEQMAKRLDRLIWVDDVVIEHRHHERHSGNGIAKDEVYTRNEASAREDTRIVHASSAMYDEKVALLKEAICGN